MNTETPKNEKRPAVRARVDVLESASEILVVADLPGVAKDAVNVRFENGELWLEARREAAPDFQRAFAMPDGLDPENITAKLANGVLEVHLPKARAKQPRRIEVRTS